MGGAYHKIQIVSMLVQKFHIIMKFEHRLKNT